MGAERVRRRAAAVAAQGRTLGLIGVGTIGVEIAERAEAFGMRVIALRRQAAY